MNTECPAERLLKALSGKWKPQIFHLATQGPIRFNNLVRALEGASKQSVATAIKGLLEEGILQKEVIQQKPLHIEYTLSQKGHSLIPIFQQLEILS